MVATAAAIASIASAGVGIGKSLFGGGGSANRDNYNLLLQQLEDSRQNATNAQIGGANINRLATAGYDDGSGGGLRYDPATGTWRSTLGPDAQAAQSAADQAGISRNTTDMRQAQGANARADINAAQAQPLIDAARRRYEDFRPQTAEGLTALLTGQATGANTEAYRPLVQDALRQYTRAGSGAGDVMAKLGQSQAGDLRKALIEAQIAGQSNVENINTQRRQGLAMDLGAAEKAGTPTFQYPSINPSTANKDMLAALTSRANAAGYTSALGLQGINSAQKTANDLAGNVKAPGAFENLDAIGGGLKQLSNSLKSDDLKNLGGKIGGWFGNSTPDAQIWNPDNPIGTERLGGITAR